MYCTYARTPTNLLKILIFCFLLFQYSLKKFSKKVMENIKCMNLWNEWNLWFLGWTYTSKVHNSYTNRIKAHFVERRKKRIKYRLSYISVFLLSKDRAIKSKHKPNAYLRNTYKYIYIYMYTRDYSPLPRFSELHSLRVLYRRSKIYTPITCLG